MGFFLGFSDCGQNGALGFSNESSEWGGEKKMVTLGCRSFFVGYLFWLYRRDPNVENYHYSNSHTTLLLMYISCDSE